MPLGTHTGTAHSSSTHLSPLARLWEKMLAEKKDLWVLVLYTLLSGLLSLAVPLGAQAMVNTITAGIFIQPLVVLTCLVLGGLLFAEVIKLFQLILVETLQQRIFATIALQLGQHLLKVQTIALQAEHAPELANRFFDILTIQKSVSKLLLEAPAAILQIMLGMLLMSIYSPYLMAFDFFLVLSFVLIGLLGWGGVRSSVVESAEKYNVAHWLEELARCHSSFKLAGWPVAAMQQLDDRIGRYIEARGTHFKVIARQVFGSYLLYAFASTGGLAIGGWLVINQQLTLGQLVAAELVIVIVVSALEKLVASIDQWYDLLTALEKIGHVTDLPLESAAVSLVPSVSIANDWSGASLTVSSLSFAYTPTTPVLNNISFSVAPGERLAIVGPSGQGKSTLMALACKLLTPQAGLIQVDGIDVRDWPDVAEFRQQLALVANTHQLFEGTLLDNITLGRTGINQTAVQWALEVAALTNDVAQLPDGLQTIVQSEGNNLSLGQRLRVLLARGIVHRPRLLILDEALTGVDPATKGHIIENLLSPQYPWTVLCVTHDPAFLVRCPRVGVLAQGQWIEDGDPRALLRRNDSVLTQLFPDTVLLSGWMKEGA